MNRHGAFVPLHDLEFFRQVRVKSESDTLCWPNNVDLCPDELKRDALQAHTPGQLVDASGFIVRCPEHDLNSCNFSCNL